MTHDAIIHRTKRGLATCFKAFVLLHVRAVHGSVCTIWYLRCMCAENVLRRNAADRLDVYIIWTCGRYRRDECCLTHTHTQIAYCDRKKREGIAYMLIIFMPFVYTENPVRDKCPRKTTFPPFGQVPAHLTDGFNFRTYISYATVGCVLGMFFLIDMWITIFARWSPSQCRKLKFCMDLCSLHIWYQYILSR